MPAEILGIDRVIVLIVVVQPLFGGASIPKLARSLGSARNDFEKGLAEGKDAQSGHSDSATPEGAASSQSNN
jgi:sec-independent protein translocase protein TatA